MEFYNYILEARKEINAQCVEIWTVEWESRHGQFSSDVKTKFKAFTEEQKARDFKKALEDAHKLIGNTYGTKVFIYKQKE